MVLQSGCKKSVDPEVVNEIRQQAAAAATERVAVGDWPNWRGPNHDGIAHGEHIKTDWRANGPPILWQKELGIGYSSFAVVGDRCITMGRRTARDVVYCLNSETGDELWRREYLCKLVNNLHKGGPGATPAVANDAVYTVGREGQVHCLNLEDGSVIWMTNPANQLKVKMPAWGFTSSPLVWGDYVILDFGHVVALDRTTGDIAWSSQQKYRPGYGAAAAFEMDGETLLAVLNNDCLLVVRAEDGSEVATYPWTTDHATSSTTPIVRGSYIFVSTGYNEGCSLLKLEGSTLEPVYENRDMSNHMANCVVWQDCLFGFDGNSHSSRTVKFACMDFASGELCWAERGYGCGTVTMADDTLVVLSDDGDLVLIRPDREVLQEIARAPILSPTCWTVPVIANGLVYCRNDLGQAVCVDLRAQNAAP
jgi:outer membrane protein assembly factor BamB